MSTVYTSFRNRKLALLATFSISLSVVLSVYLSPYFYLILLFIYWYFTLLHSLSLSLSLSNFYIYRGIWYVIMIMIHTHLITWTCCSLLFYSTLFVRFHMILYFTSKQDIPLSIYKICPKFVHYIPVSEGSGDVMVLRRSRPPPAARNGVNAITQKPRDGLFSNLAYTLVMIVSWPD